PAPVATGGDCRPATPLLPGDATCATANRGDITTSWLTANKSDGTPNHTLHTSEFFEGGLDLTKTGLGGKCFSSFLGDTRSSQSLTATIFDYAGGKFEPCGATIKIEKNAVNKVGDTHTFTVTIGTSNGNTTTAAPNG